MNFNRAALLLSLLVLLFFVSTSSGLADLSAAQDALRALQLKLVGQKVRQLQDDILQFAKQGSVSSAPSSAPTPTPEGMSQRIQTELTALESLVASLKPRALDERIAALQSRINAISQEIQTATGARLQQLQADLQVTLADYEGLQQEVHDALDATLKEQQAAALRQQIKILQEKILLLPRQAPSSPPQFSTLQDQVQKVQLKLIQAQIVAIQQKIQQLQGQ